MEAKSKLDLEYINDNHWRAFFKGKVFEMTRINKEWIVSLPKNNEEVYRVRDGNFLLAMDFVQNWQHPIRK